MGPYRCRLGFYQHGRVKTAEFYSWLRSIFVARVDWRLFRKYEDGTLLLLEENEQVLPAADYVVLCAGVLFLCCLRARVSLTGPLYFCEERKVCAIELTPDKYRRRTLSEYATAQSHRVNNLSQDV
jgi:hypothetical protein